jgi:hypothetical protein
VVFTVTCQGICGFTERGANGSGFCYPDSGDNHLYIGSVWVGNSADYVVNRDYSSEGPGDWKVTETPDGKVRMGGAFYSDQDGWAMYNDAGDSTPKCITVTQRSWAWQNDPYNDFVIMRYTIRNDSSAGVQGMYVGQFMDFDVHYASSNYTATDTIRRFIYQWSDSYNERVGVRLLAPKSAVNVSALDYATYVSPSGYILDSDKIKFLNSELSISSSEEKDWSMVVSAGPFDLSPSQEAIVAFAIVGGDSEIDAKTNSDRAQEIYDSLIGTEDTPLSVREFFEVYPNPFRMTALINFQSLLKAGVSGEGDRVTLKIYDLSGRQVRTLIDAPISTYVRDGMIRANVCWEGKDNYTKNVPSGIYFCRISAGRIQKVKKLVLIR